MASFEKVIEIRWSDVDMNRHVRHSAYYDYAAHMRVRFLAEFGFDSAKMMALKMGPILFHESCSFIREVHLEDTIKANILIGDLAPDGSRWTVHHEILSLEGEKLAHITVKGAWIDLLKRKLTAPPQEIVEAFKGLPEGENYSYN